MFFRCNIVTPPPKFGFHKVVCFRELHDAVTYAEGNLNVNKRVSPGDSNRSLRRSRTKIEYNSDLLGAGDAMHEVLPSGGSGDSDRYSFQLTPSFRVLEDPVTKERYTDM